MRVPLSWLRELTPLETRPTDRTEVAALAADLDALGLVVEGVERVGEGLRDVVLARVLEIAAIAKADKIRRVVVDAGGSEPVEVVCGAWNFDVGDLVVLAPVGAVLPGEFRIEQRRMRGVVSNGMLCSGRELRLSEDQEGILVLGRDGGQAGPAGPAGPWTAARADAEPRTAAHPDAEPRTAARPDAGPELGLPLADYLGAAFEPDVVFDLAIEGNRPDCLCVAGIARDIGARLGLPLRLPEPVVESGPEPARSYASVEVLAPELCHRLIGKVLLGVTSVASPAVIGRRLTLAGMRPIDSIVDASNYVMLELGQPTHPYDLDRLGGHGLRVRAARPGEEIVTLDGVTRVLGTRPAKSDDSHAGSDCLICDADDRPVGIGGVMGGQSSEITTEASRVLLEVGYFVPLAIARTARRVGLRSEASVRFERGVDPKGMERAALRFCELVIAASRSAGVAPPVVASGLLDAHPVPYAPRRIRVRTERVGALLGIELQDAEIGELLEPLGFVTGLPASTAASDALQVEVPSFRPDVRREVDVAEEVARRIGYQELPTSQRRSPYVGRLTDLQSLRRRLKRILAGLGADEAWTMPIVEPRDQARGGVAGPLVTLLNPMVTEESALRGGLLPGLLGALRHNVDHRHPAVRLFEIGDVFALPREPITGSQEDRELPEEWELVGLLLADLDDDAGAAVNAWRVIADALRLEGADLRPAVRAGLHPARTAEIVACDIVLGVVGEVDPETLLEYDLVHTRAGWLELDLLKLAAAPRRPLVARPVSRFPSSDVDLAFVVADSVPAAAIEVALGQVAGELCESVVLFDIYRGAGVGEGSRSLAYRLRFCALDRTLTDAEVAELRAQCISGVESQFQATLRG
ncbi:MAG: phenylalanine--tRNA ligase subunit beta [Acidimicrobiales bacterium]